MMKSNGIGIILEEVSKRLKIIAKVFKRGCMKFWRKINSEEFVIRCSIFMP